MRNLFWSYPEWLRSLVDRLIRKKDTWEIHAVKTEGGEYVFTYPPFIWNESLCGVSQVLFGYAPSRLWVRLKT